MLNDFTDTAQGQFQLRRYSKTTKNLMKSQEKVPSTDSLKIFGT